MSQDNVLLEDRQSSYDQDLTELLGTLFFGGYHQEIPDEEGVKDIIKTIPLNNEYGQKYVKEIAELYDTRQAESAEFSQLEDYLARVYYKHELETNFKNNITQSGGSLSTSTLEETYEEVIVADEMMGEEEESPMASESDFVNDCIGSIQAIEEESPADIFGTSPLFTVKSDLASINTVPTEQERFLLEKYAVLFSDPLFKPKAMSTLSYPSNYGVTTRLSASGNKLKNTICSSSPKTTFNANEQKDSGAKVKTKPVFQVIPSEVVFPDCKPGKIYQATLELKNVTSSAQQCNVLPPQSGFFLIGEGQYPTANKNFVAPGLSCIYTIKFRPKFFKNYDDKIRVHVSHGQSFDVMLHGKRTEPKLELHHKFNCRDCFCGNEVKIEFVIRNVGGKARFWFYLGSLENEDVKKIFDDDSQQNNYNSALFEMENFVIAPEKFALKSKESQKFTLTFKPHSPGYFYECISILCDNMTCVDEFSVTGRSISLNKHSISLKCRWNFVRPQENWDVFADHFLNFETIYAGNEESLSFTMKNNSSISLKYHWKTFHPVFNPEKVHRVAVNEPTLSIHPLNGELNGHSEQTVTLIYKPEKESALHVVVQLIIENIPRAALDKTAAMIDNLSSDYNFVNVYMSFVDVQGKCIEYNLAISPPQLLIHGGLEIGTTHRQLIQIINHKRVPAYFKWSRCSYPNFVEVEPAVGFIGATYEMTLEVKITGSRVGKFVETLYCEIQGVKTLLNLQVVYRICGHKIAIENGNINLGIIRAGCKGEGCLSLRNTVPVRVPWKLWDATRSPFGNETKIIRLDIYPEHGTLEPLSIQKVSISCEPNQAASIRNTLELEVEDAFQSCVAVMGEVIEPNVYLQTCTFFAGTVYRSVPFTTIITLINNSALDTTFCWDEAEGVDAKSCTIHFEPTKGSIGALESKAVCVTCTVNYMISFHDVCVPCWIDGMTEPIYWSVSGEVNGIEIFCSLDNDSRRYCATLKEGGCEDEPHFDVDFGAEVQIGTTVVREFHVTNNSAIMAVFKATGTNFIATHLDEWQKAFDNNDKLPDYSNKKIQGTLEEFLKSKNYGLAFIILPPIGWIPAFNTANIQIIGLADMWGYYTEMINVQVSEVKPIHMKVSFNAVGIPFKFLAAPRYESKYKLRLGNHLIDGKKETRKVNVVNTGPCDLTVDFKSYVNTMKGKKPFLVKIELHKYEEVIYPDGRTCNRSEIPPVRWIFHKSQTRKKLIDLNLLPYLGEYHKKTFYLSPNPLIVKARSESVITVVFTPPSRDFAKKFNRTGIPSICCHCVGTVVLNKNMLRIKNKVSRQHGRKLTSINFDINALLIVPQLIHVPDDDDEDTFTFQLNGGDFLFGKPETVCLEKMVSFRNVCAVPIHVTFRTTCPFYITVWKENTAPAVCGKDVDATKPILIESQNIVQLRLEFCLKRYEVDKICHTAPCHKCEARVCSKNCICNFCKDEKPHQLFFERLLIVDILEDLNWQEKFPLTGIIFLPHLETASKEIDFGICFAGQITCQGVGILNPSSCDSSFCVVYESNSNEFRVEPTEGNVPARYSDKMPGRMELDVYFKPKFNIEYTQSVIIHGPFGMDPLRVELKGIGTYDSRYRRDYDVLDST